MNQYDIFDGDAPFAKEVESRLRRLFCEGVIKTEGLKLAKIAAFYSITTMFTSPIIIIFGKWSRLLLVFVFWLVIKSQIQFIPNISSIFWITALFMIFHEDAIATMSDIAKASLIAITNGAVLKWCCQGYLDSQIHGHLTIGSKHNSGLITILVDGVNLLYKQRYSNLLDLYLASSSEEGQKNLKNYLNGESAF